MDSGAADGDMMGGNGSGGSRVKGAVGWGEDGEVGVVGVTIDEVEIFTESARVAAGLSGLRTLLGVSSVASTGPSKLLMKLFVLAAVSPA